MDNYTINYFYKDVLSIILENNKKLAKKYILLTDEEIYPHELYNAIFSHPLEKLNKLGEPMEIINILVFIDNNLPNLLDVFSSVIVYRNILLDKIQSFPNNFN